MSATTGIQGPHRGIASSSLQEQFLAALFDRMWDQYRRRVSYVQTYEQVVLKHGGTFVNDHIAFRTFGCQQPMVGINSLSRVFEALGYRAAGSYHFEDKNLSAVHFQHENGKFPKLFISELKTWELPPAAQDVIARTLASHRAPISNATLTALRQLEETKPSQIQQDALLAEVVDWFQTLPWSPPQRKDVTALNAVSQYGAWVLVHGYNVNHYTSLVNSHGVSSLDDLEKTLQALAAAGVPLKNEIEGERGSKLRQSATEAVRIDVSVRDGDQSATMPWSYAYFELAERNAVIDPSTGKSIRFEGFLGPQATNLFEMTRLNK